MAKVAELEEEGEKMIRKIKFLTTEEQVWVNSFVAL